MFLIGAARAWRGQVSHFVIGPLFIGLIILEEQGQYWPCLWGTVK